jgi:histidinol-phosphate aminotransferase
MTIHRRRLLKNGSLALAGLTFLNQGLFADPLPVKSGFRLPGSVIKLSANENPYGPSPAARAAMLEAVTHSNRYPWDVTTKLREKIAAHFGLAKEYILIGAGSSEILGLVAQHAASLKGNAVAADPTFGIWWNAAEKSGLKIHKVALDAQKKHDLAAMLAAINNETKLVYVCNPNNPTGTVLAPAAVKSFIEEVSRKTLVLLDEAYVEYSDLPSMAAMVANNKNLVIAKTFSKIYGMAGARIGYAIAHPETIRELNAYQPWANAGASAVSLAGALACFGDEAFLSSVKQKNREALSLVYQTMKELNIAHCPTSTNFLYYSAKEFKGDLPGALQNEQILAGRIVEEKEKWTRISIGTMDEMKIYTAALRKLWKTV